MERNYVNIFSGLFLLIFSIVMFVQVYNIEALTDSLVGSDFMPKVVSILMAVMSIVIIVSGLVKGEVAENSSADGQDSKKENKNYGLVILSMILMLIYLILISHIGFLITTSVYLFIQMLIFSELNFKNIMLYLIISIGTTMLIYYVFRNVFYVMLPSGILG